MKKHFLHVTVFLLCTWPAAYSGGANGESDYLLTGLNTARKVYISASSSSGVNNRAIKALDTDRKTSWISAQGGGPQWISIDFGLKRLLTSIVVYPARKDNARPFTRFKLQFLDGDWFDFATVRVSGRTEIDLIGVDASTFRIYIPADALPDGVAAIAEIEAYVGGTKISFYDERLKSLCLPVRNAYLPSDDYNYPNAPRSYRGGRHAGLDLYTYHTDDSYDPLPVTRNTPVLAADDGIVIRADHDYTPTDITEWTRRSAYFRTHPSTFMRRSFGGREVWIDHRNGVITTYNHLSGIERSVKKGTRVSRGQHIGQAGNSGLAGEAEGKDYGIHLHFEIWVDGCYLGYGMSPFDVKKYFRWIFSVER
ncbi:MAG TPA: peptidoglycan DD-metalloendopeptidase family protein [Spirochaetota bacterium]|nr:M23 family metallopeptidase [Spirochaetota bacterium]HOD13260.1 peptidoglycan DD-metalloendopeptidase family protein [Spirochaetota bacterium]HPG48932.1 peptidoglycan DD-metalloendopeptidase family protein [Spirochaetota bacterium]HPN10842.1 peptidoglycan DD-metalloendopeptidase family protein [Spirochaetota bacterium]HQL82670.1 peptidoglycan DD-metalloendopeptidase family protein [Spirochaetota bacterium]